ncbi:MAG TPA: FKBP-type peptidyl-prolyl cis-trans isomerase [Algoriphagus sp.]|nr:FKBP-type peptidyl-prolyl cis-trans isomerase [Algoriphagus sp.]
MHSRLFAFAALLLGTASFVSCIDPDQTQEVIFQENKDAIEKYLLENPFDDAVKEYGLVNDAFYIFWETSVSPEINTEMLRGDTVTVNYTGRLLSDEVFDSSIEQVAKDNEIYQTGREYKPLTFPNGLGGFLTGFEFGISKMKPGEKATVIFPSGMGYGSNPREGIPANSPLIFEIELIKVKKGPNHTNP